MAEIDRQIAAQRAMARHHNFMMQAIDQIINREPVTPPATLSETWLLRQLRNMRIDAQLAGQEHEADVLTLAIEELGGTL